MQVCRFPADLGPTSNRNDASKNVRTLSAGLNHLVLHNLQLES